MEELPANPPVETDTIESPAPSPLDSPRPPDLPRPLPVQLWSVLVLVAFLLGLGAGYMVWAKPSEAKIAAAEQKAAEAEQKYASVNQTATAGQSVESPEQVKRYPVPEDGDPVYGSSDAPITIIEFSDYECPYCKRWHQEAWPQIKAKYGDKVRLVYRDFPLESIHPNAAPAAEAANCAGEQNRYFDYNDLLFAGAQLGESTYEAYAQQLGLNMDDFKKCIAEGRYKTEVQDDLSYAAQLGVRSTPTFFINGLAVVGAQPFEVFQQIIDMELEGKIPK